MSILKKTSDLPTPSGFMAWAEFVESTGVQTHILEEIVAMGWLEVRRPSHSACLFYGGDVYRVRKLERICCDFELPAVGGVIIVDLLERIDRLERQLRSSSQG